MELDPSQTPDRYKTVSVVDVLDPQSQGSVIKVFENKKPGGETFFHVAREPPVEEISSPEDIKTLKAYTVGSDETKEEVKSEAIKEANKLV